MEQVTVSRFRNTRKHWHFLLYIIYFCKQGIDNVEQTYKDPPFINIGIGMKKSRIQIFFLNTIWFSFFLMVSFVLRHNNNYGVDTLTYQEYFDSITGIEDVFNYRDVGFYLMMFIFKPFGFNFFLKFVVLAGLLMLFYSYKIALHDKSPWVTAITFLIFSTTSTFIFNEVNIIRQGLASYLLLAGVVCCLRKFSIAGYSLLLSSVLMHKYALILIICFICSKFVTTRQTKLYFLPALTASLIVGIFISGKFWSYVTVTFDFNTISQTLEAYTGSL